MSGGPAAAMDQPHVIPSQGDLLGDLLNLDLGPPVNVPQVSSMQMGAVDLLGGGLDSLVRWNTHTHTHADLDVGGWHWLKMAEDLIGCLCFLVYLEQWFSIYGQQRLVFKI